MEYEKMYKKDLLPLLKEKDLRIGVLENNNLKLNNQVNKLRADITKLNSLIEIKNKELRAHTSVSPEVAKLKAVNKELTDNLISLISDMKTYIQLNISGVDLANASIGKSIEILERSNIIKLKE